MPVRACVCSCVSNKCVYVRLPAGVCMCMYALCAHLCMSAWVRVSMCVSNWRPSASRGFCMQWTFGATRDALPELSLPGVQSKTLGLGACLWAWEGPGCEIPRQSLRASSLGVPLLTSGEPPQAGPQRTVGAPRNQGAFRVDLSRFSISRGPGVCFHAGARSVKELLDARVGRGEGTVRGCK